MSGKQLIVEQNGRKFGTGAFRTKYVGHFSRVIVWGYYTLCKIYGVEIIHQSHSSKQFLSYFR